MSDNRRRFAEFLETERRDLITAAARARVLDHMGTRGSDFESAVRKWIRRIVAPEYLVSHGEVIDEFNSEADLDSRQHDAIVHQNSRHARRFTFGSHLRLVPIETIALIVEIKVSIDADRFRIADRSATQTSSLRLAVDKITRPIDLKNGTWNIGRDGGPSEGTSLSDAFKRVWFGVLVADGPSPETIADWLREAKTIDFVCCLQSGCVFRTPIFRNVEMAHPALKYSQTADASGSLAYFADLIHMALNNFEHHAENTYVEFGGRYAQSALVRHYDGLGYKTPPGITYREAELAELRRRGFKVE